MNKKQEQKLKDEYENTILKAVAILRAVDREGDARELENSSEEIVDDWIIEKELEEVEKQWKQTKMREQKPAEKQERVKEEQEKKQARAEDIIEGADSLEEAEKQLEGIGY